MDAAVTSCASQTRAMLPTWKCDITRPTSGDARYLVCTKKPEDNISEWTRLDFLDRQVRARRAKVDTGFQVIITVTV